MSRHVLNQPLIESIEANRDRPSPYLPTILLGDEIHRLFHHLHGTHPLLAKRLYGKGISLRVKGIDPSRIIIREPKGNRNKTTVMPQTLQP